MDEEKCKSPIIGGYMEKRRKPITTARRRELLALAIKITDLMLSGCEDNERQLLFRMIEMNFDR